METTKLASTLRDITSKMHKRLRKQIQTVDNLSLTECTTLSYLYHNGALYPSEMAGLVKIRAQSMSQIINRLDGLKLITKTPSETDKRKVAIALNDAGKKIVEQSRYERDEWLTSAIEHHLSAGEKQILQQAVALMEKLVEYK